MDKESRKLKIHMLGPFRVEVEGRMIPREDWKSRKARTLFQYLASKRGEKVPKDVLINLLWPGDIQDERMNQNLHTTIHFVRHVLEPDLKRYEKSSYIQSSDGFYWLDDSSATWVDILQYEILVKSGKELTPQDGKEALSRFRRALDLYHGCFLSEEIYDEWTFEIREYFDELYMDTVLKTAQLLIEAQRDYSEAVRILRAALTKDVFREELHQQVIRGLLAAGRYSEALTHYRDFAQLIREEFGLDPSPDTQKLLKEHFDAPIEEDEDNPDILGRVVGSDGPMVCDRDTFQTLHQLERRRQERHGSPIVLLSIKSREGRLSEKAVKSVGRVLADTLRKEDVLCQWDGAKIVSLLSGAEPEAGRLITERVQAEFKERGLSALYATYETHYPTQSENLLVG